MRKTEQTKARLRAEIEAVGCDRAAYRRAKRRRATHDEILAACKLLGKASRGVARIFHYVDALVAGANHEQCMEAYAAGAKPAAYAQARCWRISHEDFMKVHKAKIDLEMYAKARRMFASHEDFMAVYSTAGTEGLRAKADDMYASAKKRYEDACAAYLVRSTEKETP